MITNAHMNPPPSTPPPVPNPTPPKSTPWGLLTFLAVLVFGGVLVAIALSGSSTEPAAKASTASPERVATRASETSSFNDDLRSWYRIHGDAIVESTDWMSDALDHAADSHSFYQMAERCDGVLNQFVARYGADGTQARLVAIYAQHPDPDFTAVANDMIAAFAFAMSACVDFDVDGVEVWMDEINRTTVLMATMLDGYTN